MPISNVWCRQVVVALVWFCSCCFVVEAYSNEVTKEKNDCQFVDLNILTCEGITYFYYLEEDIPERSLRIYYDEPEWASGHGDMFYFIVDYEAMTVYDAKCLHTLYITVDKDDEDEIIFLQSGKDEFTSFKREDFEQCKQLLSDWVKSKPWDEYTR